MLETDYPPLSPLVWTTMMTGAGPLDHGILDFTRFNPVTRTTRSRSPATSGARRRSGTWLTWAGKQRRRLRPLGHVGRPSRCTASTSPTACSRFSTPMTHKPAGVVWPPIAAAVVARRRSPRPNAAVDAAAMREYLPSLTDEEFAALAEKHESVRRSARRAAAHPRRDARSTDALSDGYLHERAALPDLTIVYLQGTDTIGHVFAPFAPPKQPRSRRPITIATTPFRRATSARSTSSSAATRESPSSDGAVLMIASDHGFFWREGRPTQISSTATATAAKWHRKEGIYSFAVPASPPRPDIRCAAACGRSARRCSRSPECRRRRTAARRLPGAAERPCAVRLRRASLSAPRRRLRRRAGRLHRKTSRN